ncbi:uncharacterized protein [Amphiura filiformis]|uniref:uncharacterized protein isoform X2 n=1 Tax=Amphiura filiformis TaxID=82378 RepID=UPI003B212030
MHLCFWLAGFTALFYLLSTHGCVAQDDELSPTITSVPVMVSSDSNNVVHNVLEYFRRTCLAIISFVIISLVMSAVSISIFVYLDYRRVQNLPRKQRREVQYEDHIADPRIQQVPDTEQTSQRPQAPIEEPIPQGAHAAYIEPGPSNYPPGGLQPGFESAK